MLLIIPCPADAIRVLTQHVERVRLEDCCLRQQGFLDIQRESGREVLQESGSLGGGVVRLHLPGVVRLAGVSPPWPLQRRQGLYQVSSPMQTHSVLFTVSPLLMEGSVLGYIFLFFEFETN